jgi:chorismate synthase
LVESFLIENDSTEVLEGTRSAEKELTKGTPVFLNILNINTG